jgi:hypothetical protein
MARKDFQGLNGAPSATEAVPGSVEAALEQLRSFSAAREREQLRSLEDAFLMLDRVSVSLLAEEEGALDSHSQLYPSSSQQHLA